jgi:hypothetical protein
MWFGIKGFEIKEITIGHTRILDVRFEVFMVVRMMMMIFWVLALCRLVSRCQGL